MINESKHFVIGLVLGVALAGVSTVGYSQVAIQPKPAEPKVFTGDDLGFRISGRKGDKPLGQLVVRVDGEWREVEFSYGLKLLTQ